MGGHISLGAFKKGMLMNQASAAGNKGNIYMYLYTGRHRLVIAFFVLSDCRLSNLCLLCSRFRRLYRITHWIIAGRDGMWSVIAVCVCLCELTLCLSLPFRICMTFSNEARHRWWCSIRGLNTGNEVVDIFTCFLRIPSRALRCGPVLDGHLYYWHLFIFTFRACRQPEGVPSDFLLCQRFDQTLMQTIIINNIYICILIYWYMYIHMNVYIGLYIYTYLYIHVHMHIYIYIHIYIYQ